jgi:hypothetical protein
MPTQIPIPQVKLGKRKERSQMWEMFTDDGRCVDLELPVLTGCCDDPTHSKGFLLDADNQYTDERGYWIQVGWDRSLMPLCMIGKTKILGMQNKDGVHDDDALITDLVDQIFHEAKEGAQEKLWEGIAKNLLLDKLTWFIAIPCITALIAFGMIWIRR